MDNKITMDTEVEVLKLNKEGGYNYRERRQDDWKENYTLYRDKVTVNRLTQRQSVNIPIMKQTIRTLLKDVDDMPVLYFENLDNNKDKEVFLNEYWKWTLDYNKMELADIMDKRQVFLYGRSFDQMQIIDGKVKMTIIDPEDILVDRFMDPVDLDSSRYLIHTHIFVPFSVLENNPMYDQDKIKELKIWYGTEAGLIKAADNKGMLEKKNEKMSELGLTDASDPILGEAIVELSMHFVYDKKKGSDEEELFLKVEADDMKLLMSKPLEEVIGKTVDNYWRTHFPYNSWADDLDKQDFWSDGIADIVRTPNKVLNAWFSQMVENRTLRNMNMNIYDSTLEGFVPQTWEPRAWGMYGVPVPPERSLKDVFQQLPVADLSDSLDELTFVIQTLEKATGATATQQGVQTERQITLGEVQLALGEAKERIKGMSKFYTSAWKDRGQKFLKMVEAASDQLEAVKVYKKGRNSNNIYMREISPEDWKSKSGYTVRVWSQDEKESQDTQALEKINAAKVNMPDNPKVDEVWKRKLLEFSKMTPDEVNEAMKFEEEKRNAMLIAQQQMGAGMGAPMGMQPQAGMPPQIPATPAPQPNDRRAAQAV